MTKIHYLIMSETVDGSRDTIDNGPCQKLACAIQVCLDKNNWDSDKCEREFDKYKECMVKYKASKNQKEGKSS